MRIRIVKPDIIPYPYDFDGVPEGHRHAYAVENTIEIDLLEFSQWYRDQWFVGKGLSESSQWDKDAWFAKEGNLVHYDSIQFLLAEFIKNKLEMIL